MTWRVIVRISFTRDKGSRLRYRVEECLKACGIRPRARGRGAPCQPLMLLNNSNGSSRFYPIQARTLAALVRHA